MPHALTGQQLITLLLQDKLITPAQIATPQQKKRTPGNAQQPKQSTPSTSLLPLEKNPLAFSSDQKPASKQAATNQYKLKQPTLGQTTNCIDPLQSATDIIQHLAKHQIISPHHLTTFLVSHYNIPAYNLGASSQPESCTYDLPLASMQQHCWLALDKTANSLIVGCYNPELYQHQHQLELQINCKVHLQLLDYTTCQHWHALAYKRAFFASYQQAQSHYAIADLFSYILRYAITQRASDLHFEPNPDHITIRLRIQGILHLLTQLHRNLYSQLLNFIKIQANLDISQQRLPQDGSISYKLDDHLCIDCRVSTGPFQYANFNYEKCVLRLLQNHNTLIKYTDLGMTPAMQQIFYRAIHAPQGLILVTGPTGSGKTHTLYAALAELNTLQRHIVSIEDPIEIPLPGIFQQTAQPNIGLDFTTALRSFLRQDPDIIMLGEIRDAQTASMALNAAQTGHLVLATLHTNSACQTISRLLQLGLPAYQIADSLQLIIAQRLVRTLCRRCNSAAKPSTENSGCQACHAGWHGRAGVFELLAVTSSLREQIYQYQSASLLETFALKHGFNPLQHHAKQLIAQRRTNRQEVTRVLGWTS